MPSVAIDQRIGSLVDVYSIDINFAHDGVSRGKFFIDLSSRADNDIGRQDGRGGDQNLIDRNRAVGVKTYDLSSSVDAGVGSSCGN